jgi:hypothetical protein
MRAPDRPLTPGWVAGSVRARHMLARRLGRDGAHQLADSGSLDRALAMLAGSAYGRSVRAGADLAAAQRAVADAVLWHIRVLAGWAPPGALEAVRALAAWFELANVEERLRYVEGGMAPDPFELGGLGAAWPRLADAQSAADLRARLTGTAWGDPGSDDGAAIRLALRMSWARRVLAAVDEAAAWAAGAVALLLARELFLAGRSADALAALRPPGVGSEWSNATSVAALRAALPAEAAWALAGVDDASELWRAETAWWRRVDADATHLARHAHLGMPAVVGCVALLGIDGRRTAAALEVAARGGAADAREAFEHVA